jgi:hypothetical protein
MATTRSLQNQCSWNPAAAEGTFYLGEGGANVECIVPLETLLDRYPASSSTDEDTFRANERMLRVSRGDPDSPGLWPRRPTGHSRDRLSWQNLNDNIITPSTRIFECPHWTSLKVTSGLSQD